MADNNKKDSGFDIKKWFDFSAPVFWPAVSVAFAFIAVTLYVGDPMGEIFVSIQNSISTNAGWFFIMAVNIFLVFMIYLAFSRFGYIKLGGKNSEPEFSTTAWFAMLFSAGMGIGILFYGVAEPVMHYINPPIGDGETRDASSVAMRFTFLHWGFHTWAIYALVAMSLAFFAFNKGLPLSIRSVFYPVFGDRIYGPWGHFIDVVAVIATLFGLATSLGFGVTQISTGLQHLFGFEATEITQVLLIAGITAVTIVSVVLGIDKGVKVLSELNIRIAAAFLIFILIFGPTVFILGSYLENTGNYFQYFLEMSLFNEAFKASQWQNDWTVFYWAWWISWSPFVGIFIARVSKGRTIKEFVLGVLIVPSLLTFFWLTTFGGSAIYIELNNGGGLASAVQDDVANALFVFLDFFPLSFISSLIAVLLITSFFITSSDSGSLVIDALTSGGKIDTPFTQRAFWAVSVGSVAAVLLVGGGLQALQTAAITTGLPFTFVLLFMAYSLHKGLDNEHKRNLELMKEKDRSSYEKTIGDIIEKRRKS